jgi:hypothetical protein
MMEEAILIALFLRDQYHRRIGNKSLPPRLASIAEIAVTAMS